MQRWYLVGTCGAFLGLSACGSELQPLGPDTTHTDTSDDTDTQGPSSVSTLLGAAVVQAGEELSVRCALTPPDEAYGPADFEVSVHGPEGGVELVRADDGAVSFAARTIGTYQVHCALPALALTDSEGASFEVTLGEVVRVELSLDAPMVVAGESVNVSCVGHDAFGNSAALSEEAWTVPSELSLEGETLSGESAGSYILSCGEGAGVEVSETLVVVPAPPERIELNEQPRHPHYALGDVLHLSHTIYDRFDNQITDLDAVLTVSESPAPTVVDEAAWQYRLDAEGRYRFTAHVEAPYEHIEDSVEVFVDTSAPVLVVEAPVRGQTYLTGAEVAVARGQVSDATSAVSLRIQGQEVALSEEGHFEIPLELAWGVNSVSIEARDAAGNLTRMSPAVLVSDAYHDASQSQHARENAVANGVRLWTSPQAYQSDLVSSEIKDAAGLAAHLFATVNVNPLVSAGLHGAQGVLAVPLADERVELPAENAWLNLRYTGEAAAAVTLVGEAQWALPEVAIALRAGGLDLSASFGEDGGAAALTLPLALEIQATYAVESERCDATGCVPQAPGTASGVVSVPLHLVVPAVETLASIDLDKQPGEALVTALADLETVVATPALSPLGEVPLTLTVQDVPGLTDSDRTIALHEQADLEAEASVLLNTLSERLVEEMHTRIHPRATNLVAALHTRLEGLAERDTTVELPNLLNAGGPALTVGLWWGLDHLTFSPQGAVASAAAGVHADSGLDLAQVGHPDEVHETTPRGIPLRGDCLSQQTETFSWTYPYGFALGAHQDLVNTLMHSIWHSGALNAPLGLSWLERRLGNLPFSDLEADMSWVMLPVYNDCAGTSRFQAGDVFFVVRGMADGAPFQVELYLDMEVGLGFETDETGLYAVVTSVEPYDIELITVDQGGLDPNINLRELLTTAMPELVREALVGRRAGPVELPPIPLSRFLKKLPSDAFFNLGPLHAFDGQGYGVIAGDWD